MASAVVSFGVETGNADYDSKLLSCTTRQFTNVLGAWVQTFLVMIGKPCFTVARFSFGTGLYKGGYNVN